MNNPCTSLRYRKMGLTGLHDFVDLWHLYICHSLFGHSTVLLLLQSCEMGLTKPTRLLRFVTFVHLPFSVRSLDLFCRLTRVFEAHFVEEFYKWNWAVRSCQGKVVYCSGSFLLQAMFLTLQVFAFVEFNNLFQKSPNLFYSVKRFPSSCSIRHSVRRYWSSLLVMKTR